MGVFDSHEISSESSISLASSVFTHDPDFSPYDSYAVDSDAPDDMDVDVDDDVHHHQHYGPPTYESLMLENATVRSDADFFSVTGWTTATIGSSSVVSTSDRMPHSGLRLGLSSGSRSPSPGTPAFRLVDDQSRSCLTRGRPCF
ncbi:hypothetical protein FLAG1_06105 [Fusarium langsethiae]|uniref:Uncharacterized protein n=1 Tax=Fusarium langsethiae TaxID=179993 RepID=A0A0M9EWF7_FUSLA|nr:hypothetical protein FLAG1_06105 [Fusarium langsethiae]GKT98704.1 unnamed protein product [Fusarium langsethiae]GKU18017.1 unnamed protein product [Fusarium langsethiae]